MHWFTMPTSFSLWCKVVSVDEYKDNIFQMSNTSDDQDQGLIC